MKYIKPKRLLIVLLLLILQVGCNRSNYPAITHPSPSPVLTTQPAHTSVIKPITPTPQKPTPTSRITVTSIKTVKSSSTPTLEPTLEIIRSKPNCTLGKPYTKCIDKVMQIEVEYPSQWGEITTLFRKGFISGYAYDYQFGIDQSESRIYIEAGGRSINFSERRGGNVADFPGFITHIPGQGCLNSQAAYCKEIKPGVILEVYAGRAKDLCQPAPGIYGYPVGEVKIDLPDNTSINGFVFATGLLSEEMKVSIGSALGYEKSSGYYTKCSDEKIINQVNAKIEAILQGLTTISLDKETNQNFIQILHLAQSIKFIK